MTSDRENRLQSTATFSAAARERRILGGATAAVKRDGASRNAFQNELPARGRAAYPASTASACWTLRMVGQPRVVAATPSCFSTTWLG